MTQPSDPRRVSVIVELIDHTVAIAELNDRTDLAQRLGRARERITDPQIRVVIAGQLKQGKSQLLNSLLNLPVARVGDDEATVVITIVGYGDPPSARLVVAAGPDGEPAAVDIPIDDISTDLRRAPQAGGREVLRAEIGAPSPLFKGGLAFVDTPGVGGHGQPHLSATLGLLPDADALIMVSDTSQEFTEPEMRFIRQAHRICPVARAGGHQDRPVSALARHRQHQHRAPAARRGADSRSSRSRRCCAATPSTLNDQELNEESNFPSIVKFLSEKVLSRETDRVRDAVLAEIRSAAEQLTHVCQAPSWRSSTIPARGTGLPTTWSDASRKRRTRWSRPRCGSRCSTTDSPI